MEGVKLKAVSLRDLIILKCHAIKHGHAGRVLKDIDDVIHLVLANKVNLEDDCWRELVLKYGTAELYEILQRACKD